jgi:hypothetical protein
MKITINAQNINQVVNADHAVVHSPAVQASLPPAADEPPPKVFLSYRRDDSRELAERIYDRLVAKLGKPSVFKDVDSIPYGADFRRVLERALQEADVFLAVIGPKWLDIPDEQGGRRLDATDDYVRTEIETALGRGVKTIPLLVEGANMPTAQTLPASLRDFAFHQGTVVRNDPDFHRDMDRLIEQLASRGKTATKDAAPAK